MNIVFMGTPGFAVPALRKLAASRHRLLCVVTQPDRPSGRGLVPLPPPVKICAAEYGLPILQPVSLVDEDFLRSLRDLAPDLVVVVAYRILPAAVITLPSHGCVNLHASLLPNYRGAAPMAWAIIKGESVTGLTTFFIEATVDTGDIILQREVPILPDETCGELAERMQTIGADLLLETIDRLEAGRLPVTSQRAMTAYPAPKLSTADGLIRWEHDAVTIKNLVRGLNPKPGAYTRWQGKLLKVHRAAVVAGNGRPPVPPGTIMAADKRLVVSCGQGGALELREVQLEGKKRLSIEEFLRGNGPTKGERLGA